MGVKMNKNFFEIFSISHIRGMLKMNKKGQLAVFIIVAILIVALIILLFALRGKKIIDVINPGMPDVNNEIEKCVRDSVKNAVSIMLNQGGYISPDNYKMYEGNKIQYLCYNNNFYQTCVNQEPVYIEHLEGEIKNYISGRIEDCFYALKQEYEKKSYMVIMDGEEMSVILNPKQIKVEIDKTMDISKNQESRRYENFNFVILSPIYDLAIIAQEIVNQEAKFCYFEYQGFSLLYPDYSVEKTDINGETKIYKVKEKSTGRELVFAVRSCAMPAGI
ncbi:hypothetical protein HYW76_03145 [Candidatus Pacearchaeota archaeon]|nr:hypothetical protein [Candidatus Pacearchaeota archaeon]